MKTILTLLVLILCVGISTAQTIDLELTTTTHQFQDADVGAIALADIDNDGDLDFLATGKGGPVLTTLYLNDGSGNFSEVSGTPFVGVFSGSVGFEDVDNDGFSDLLITGLTNGATPTVNLYINDQEGNFNSMPATPFKTSYGGDFAFSDVDNDGDQDALITGLDAAAISFSTLYLNDGTGTFTEVFGTPFETAKNSSVQFIDIDNDNDEDVIIAGQNNADVALTQLYTNDGSGNFSLVANTPFEHFSNGDIAVADSDGDGNLDILISGQTASNGAISNLYLNDGAGNFSLVPGTPFHGTQVGATNFADFDNDGDLDVIIVGAGGGVVANIYENQGANTFILADELIPTYLASIAVGDINGDNLIDVIIAGTSFEAPARATKTYLNSSTVLPVELLSFTAKATNQQDILLKWETATEINSSHFSVQRSKDGLLFNEIEKVNAAGDSRTLAAYQLTDKHPLPGRSYYRLMMVDEDDTFSISDTKTVQLSDSKEVSIYPNPVTANTSLYLTGMSQGEFQLRVYDVVGKLMFQKVLISEGVSTPATVNLPALIAGTYSYSISADAALIKSGRLVVSGR